MKEYLNPVSFANYFKPIKKLFDMNDIHISWKWIYATYPELDNMPESMGWSRDEISRMLLHAGNTQDRAIILALASSGMRAGALHPLNWGDIESVYSTDGKLTMDPEGDLACAAIHMYRGSSESYMAFITPEAFGALQEYGRTWTENMGRQANPKDPVFTIMRGMPARASYQSIRKRVIRMAKGAGL